MSFVKLDTDILDSSLWMQREQREVFITALLMAEPWKIHAPLDQIEVRSLKKTGFVVPPGWYGFIKAAGSGIVQRALVPLQEGLDALEQLGSPDPESRSIDFDGRRVVRVDGGFVVLNYMKYRDRDHGAADRMKQLRQRRKEEAVAGQSKDLLEGVTANVTDSREQRADTEERSVASTNLTSKGKKAECTFEQFLADCKATGEKPLPADDPIFAYAVKIKLPLDFLRVCWREFAESHKNGQGRKYRGARGWRQAFGNCVRRNWYKLWVRDERGDWSLTTAGHQANRAHAEPPAHGAAQTGART